MLFGTIVDGGGAGLIRVQTEDGRAIEVPAECFDSVPAVGQKVVVAGVSVTGPEAARSAIAAEILNALLRS